MVDKRVAQLPLLEMVETHDLPSIKFDQIRPLHQPLYLGCWGQQRCINFTGERICTGMELCKSAVLATIWEGVQTNQAKFITGSFATYLLRMYSVLYMNTHVMLGNIAVYPSGFVEYLPSFGSPIPISLQTLPLRR